MRILLLTLVLCITITNLRGQTNEGLIAYYNFDTCTPINTSGDTESGIFVGSPDCVCGVRGNAIRLNGFDEEMLLLGSVNNYFELGDFTVSFYMKSTNAAGTQSIFNKREACDNGNRFGIRFNPLANTITVEFSEEGGQTTSFSNQLDFSTCWQHIVVSRAGGKVQLYVNGNLVKEKSTSNGARIDVRNNAVTYLGGGACVSEAVDNRFAGVIDELRIYDRALAPSEIAELYFGPDKITTRDTSIFLGTTIAIQTSQSCATEFVWTPEEGIEDGGVSSPMVTPSATTTYRVLFNDGVCTSTDSVTITVIDPEQLGCNNIYLPKAFTPNNDNVNDKYGISNPDVIEELISFEIFDRWGAKVFSTDSPFELWDGSFKGQEVNPGVMLYRVRFNCNGEERNEVGSFTIIR